ncbi:MAG TPA: hypothetical protein VF668_13740 [Pyrinomonadaceae bacterium]|jgi:anti-sigma-K factor RskA
MSTQADADRELRRYLLGALAEEAGRGVEERLMTEEDFLEEVAAAEGELIDDYVAGRLSGDERARFEGHFLSTDARRRQLKFTQTLSRYANAPAAALAAPASARGAAARTFGERLRGFWGGLTPALRAGVALAALAVIVCALWLARPAAPQRFVALTLAVGAGDRAEGVRAPGVRLPLGADALKLTLTLPEGAAPAARYRAELQGERGRAEEVEVVGQDARAVTVVVPESRLARGRYFLRLSDAGGDGRRVATYFFDAQ